ncbi:hypothetical protein ABIB57_004942 [Devosia sp. UYZn731]|uniref:DUF6931 family protein n=1 Tax=Devosia sp. UYZn731 TaxID=3156345 RepID=UPI003391502B
MQVKPHFSLARELFAAMPTLREDTGLDPQGSEAAVAYLSQARGSATPENALAYAAYLLPRREAVWWGCTCLGHVLGLLTPGDRGMLDLAARWVEDPDEPQRSAALGQAMAAPEKSAGVWIALAAGWSGGSLAGPEVARVPPPAFLTPRAVTIGTQMALAKVGRANRTAVLGSFVDSCLAMIAR